MPPLDTLEQVAAWSRERGLNLVGIADAETFDRCQPAGRRATDIDRRCRSILLLGASNSYNWSYLRRRLGAALDTAKPDQHPIDDWSRTTAGELLALLRRGAGGDGRLVLPNDARSLNFVQLGEAAGVGTISPVIEQLVHPEFGPWITLRAAILLRRDAADWDAGRAVPMEFQPCDGCSEPCTKACPADVYGALTGPDVKACVDHRSTGGCAEICDARKGCMLGVDHQPSAEEARFRQAHAMFMIRALTDGAPPGPRPWFDRLMFRRRPSAGR